jgi:hypothetical protein
MNHGPPPHGHGPPPPHHHHGHGPPDRHGHGQGHDRSRGDRGHYGGPGPNHHENNRGGRGNDRGADRAAVSQAERDNRRQSRWEQSQPTKDDQHKLQELMSEAGIAGYYKDTLEQNTPPQSIAGGPPTSQTQQSVFPPQLQNMQPPLLPLLPGFLPQMLPQAQGLSQVNNPALASVLASLNIPSSTIAPTNLPQFTSPLIDTPPGPPSQSASNQQQQQSSEQPTNQDAASSSDTNTSSIPDNLPKMQRELFLRIQQQQLKNENKVVSARCHFFNFVFCTTESCN